MLTRDSLLWFLLIAGSVLGYLVTVPPPWDWTYTQALNALIVVIGIVSGYLRSSPLPGAHDDDTVHLPVQEPKE